jgi:transposase
MRCELSDCEWTAIKPLLPNKPRGVRRVNDRRVLNGIFWVLRSGALGATRRRTTIPAPLVTIASFAGGRPESGTRYDKLAANYLAFVKLASIRIWLRANESAP